MNLSTALQYEFIDIHVLAANTVILASVVLGSLVFCSKKKLEDTSDDQPETPEQKAENIRVGKKFIAPEPSDVWHSSMADGNLVSSVGEEPSKKQTQQQKSVVIASEEASVVKGYGRETPKENFDLGYKALKAGAAPEKAPPAKEEQAKKNRSTEAKDGSGGGGKK